MILRPLAITYIQPVQSQTPKYIQTQQKKDEFVCENQSINKKPLIDRKIIKENQDINAFFDDISAQIFPNSKVAFDFSSLLKSGHIALSTSAYTDLKNPKSAVALELDPNKTNVQHCANIEQYLSDGIGIGFNLSKFNNPIETLKYINNYMKFREPNLNRPPAGIALLNIDHPKAIDFITLKNNADYENWCFNLSVVIDDDFFSKIDTDKEAQKIYLTLIDSMRKSGEPGIIFSNDKNFICDSCAASQLEANQGLTLAQINLSKFYDKSFDFDLLSKSANVLSLALKNIAPDGFISVLGYQDLLNKMELNYGSKDALEILEKSLQVIKTQASSQGLKMCISPSGATSRVLNTTPSIEPFNNPHPTYFDEIDTMKTAQKYLEGGISKTVNLKKHHSIHDVDTIVRYAKENNLKGITVFPAQ